MNNIKRNKFDFTDAIGYLAIVSIVVSLFFIGFKITGFASQSNATVNVTVSELEQINFTTNSVNFGTGAVSSGYPGANLTTEGEVTGGTWGAVSTPLVLQNIGNVNVSLNLTSNMNATTFIGSGADFEVKITDTSGHTGACTIANGFNNYKDITTTTQMVCSVLKFGAVRSIDVDVKLYIPSTSSQGTKSAIITATGTAVS
ncbi:MAG: hypothetical protein WC548_00495 [Candidatus Pacearchaeota archaeon]